jgi:glycosyltransferase involved in cell wall biosynthesis
MSEKGKVNQNRLSISVVTPTLRRPTEVQELLVNLSDQMLLPTEVIIVDGSSADDTTTQDGVLAKAANFPFRIRYTRKSGGTAIQRNMGIDLARGDLIALIDDDVRLDRHFFENIAAAFEKDLSREIGGIAGYRTNLFFFADDHRRWRWYRRLKLLKRFEPGRYDFETGYPINNSMQPPFAGLREVDFMTTACAVWRREVYDSGIRFDPFFKDYGVLEDAHFSLRAAKNWKLIQCGDAHCEELRSPNGRVTRSKIGYKCVVNYYYVFLDVAGPLSTKQKFRFWRFQLFELFRIGISGLTQRKMSAFRELGGRIQGIIAVMMNKGIKGS